MSEGEDLPLKDLMEHEDSEPLEGSLTNELVLTHRDTVLKKFNPRPSMAYIQMLGRIPSRKLEFHDHNSRIENESLFRDHVEEFDVHVPEILDAEENFVEFEKVDGLDMHTYLNKASEKEAFEAGELVGYFLSMIHSRDTAVTDLRINNFMMKDDRTLAFVDAEYFSRDATGWEKKMDLITMISSAKQVRPEAYREFRRGFKQKFEDDIGIFSEIVSSVTAPLHALLLERDIQRLKRALSNVWSDLWN